MLVLFILGAFGVKAALIVYGVYRFAKWLSDRGNKIRAAYEQQIKDLEAKNAVLQAKEADRLTKLTESDKLKRQRRTERTTVFPQKVGIA